MELSFSVYSCHIKYHIRFLNLSFQSVPAIFHMLKTTSDWVDSCQRQYWLQSKVLVTRQVGCCRQACSSHHTILIVFVKLNKNNYKYWDGNTVWAAASLKKFSGKLSVQVIIWIIFCLAQHSRYNLMLYLGHFLGSLSWNWAFIFIQYQIRYIFVCICICISPQNESWSLFSRSCFPCLWLSAPGTHHQNQKFPILQASSSSSSSSPPSSSTLSAAAASSSSSSSSSSVASLS